MTMKRTKTPWMKAEDFGRSLAHGLGVNLLVTDMAAMEAFCRDVLGARIIRDVLGAYHLWRRGFRGDRTVGLGLHAACPPLLSRQSDDRRRRRCRSARRGHRAAPLWRRSGCGGEKGGSTRPHRAGGSIDKPHGLREYYIVGPDGYVFVPSARLQA
ncbi:hypothetical protein [Mesorhizobium tamadayense]|uniref:hypothetical protein n=1 Tax=Mesorhizobium tamadayense TaxID=425306 RepID=UPI001FDEBA38|nr:hypothetical protein [Mesorhizobium tamadayense]